MDCCYVDFCEGFCYFLCDKSCIETLREVNLCFALRKLIEEARDRGELICNDGDGEGYYRSYDIGQIERQYRVDRARAMAVLKRLKTMRRMLNDAGKEV